MRTFLIIFTRIPEHTYPFGGRDQYIKDLALYGGMYWKILLWREFIHFLGGAILLAVPLTLLHFLNLRNTAFKVTWLACLVLTEFFFELYSDSHGSIKKMKLKSFIDMGAWYLGFVLCFLLFHFVFD